MTTCVVVLKSGYEIRIKCDTFRVINNMNGFVEKLMFTNPSENELWYVNCNDVAAIYQIKERRKEGEECG